MARLPGMVRWALALVVATGPLVASASTPVSTYCAPSMVEFLPDQNNATSIVVHGAFTFWLDFRPTYTAPACGYMYFACLPGQEAMCRMQWRDVAGAVGQMYCSGFGLLNMMPMGTLRMAGSPLAKPDPWELGMGVSRSFNFNITTCNATLALKCPPQPFTDAGVPPPADMTVRPPPADMTVVPPPADMTMVARPPDLSVMAPPPDLAVVAPPPDLSIPPPPADLSDIPSGRSPLSCAMTGNDRWPGSGVAGVALVLLGFVRTWRRRRARPGAGADR